ncbi:MAG: lactonase family protein [Planctomycetaceae bacterium]
MTRFRKLIQAIFITGGLLVTTASSTSIAQTDSIDVWIGTGGNSLSRGIYHCLLDTRTGRLSNPTVAAEVSGPGFLAMHPNRNRLYAVGSVGGKPSVICYAIESHDGHSALALLNALEIGDGGGTHVSVDATAKTVLTAQYGGGSVAVFSLNDDGTLKERTQLIEHNGGSRVVGNRQDAPHPHWTGFSPDNRFAFVPDLGLDKVVIYTVDAANSKITPHGFGEVPAGAGPRHMKFHTSGKWVYVLNELDLTVTVFDYNADAGTMTAKQTIEAVPKAELAKEQFTSASEIRVHPNGRFVYSANRGHDTITVFAVNPDTGELKVVEREFVRGATPRNFNLDPSARWLLAAGQDSHTLASFVVDQNSGELTYNQSVVFAPAAICVLFGPE